MVSLTFRNHQGDLVDVPSVSATQLKNELGALLDRTMQGGAVAITRYDRPRAVLISYEEFSALAKLRSLGLADLDTEFDGLLARMQSPSARAGMASAFIATPATLGKAAVRAARAAPRKRAARSRLRAAVGH